MERRPEGVTVAICTRDRSDRVGDAVRSVLACAVAGLELIIVDQSGDTRTEEALRTELGDPRVRYLRSDALGVARSRNLALELARTEVVAFTDDDCVVPADWPARMLDLFERRPAVVLAFCNVAPGPHDPRAGFIPAYRRRGTVVVGSALGKCTARGIGAGMAVRRREVLALGGFDELLGPGGPLRSAEEYDLALRVIAAGHCLCETDAVEVVHHGFRTFEEGRALTLRDWIGIGAAYSKPIKAGRVRLMAVPVYELCRYALWPIAWDLLRLRRPSGLKRVTGFFTGMVLGLRTPLDGHTLKFAVPGEVARRPAVPPA
jgi:glycosyltransferase involved in cell wall biosynthesis